MKMILMKLNPLPPTMRENHRYIVFEILAESSPTFEDIVNSIWKSSLELFGEAGTARFRLWVPSTLYDSGKKKGIVRTNPGSVEEVRAALAAIREIGNKKAAIYVLGTTGTIKSAKMKFLGIPYSTTTATK